MSATWKDVFTAALMRPNLNVQDHRRCWTPPPRNMYKINVDVGFSYSSRILWLLLRRSWKRKTLWLLLRRSWRRKTLFVKEDFLVDSLIAVILILLFRNEAFLFMIKKIYKWIRYISIEISLIYISKIYL